ncbi:hypothetical protein ACFPC0_09725 [Streptomyces andamanensis]|uniref:Sigma-70 family RNA polymerase sigma factor n=1 Tax=Streptomyces andamanensis TaxID=1565035 RepID=A0ABV8TBV3_9ACTN
MAEGRTPDDFGLEYAAFRDLHLDWYLRYAYVRTGEWTKATDCVEAVFDALSAGWAEALRSDCPAAQAWQLLRDYAGERTVCTEGHSWSIHCLLHEAQADTVLLHHRLGLSVARTADLMGLRDHAVRALLCSAQRALADFPPCIASRLRTTRSATARGGAQCEPRGVLRLPKSSKDPRRSLFG